MTKASTEKVVQMLAILSVPVTVNNVENQGSYTLAKTDSGDGYIAPRGTDEFIPITDKNSTLSVITLMRDGNLLAPIPLTAINRTAWKHDFDLRFLLP